MLESDLRVRNFGSLLSSILQIFLTQFSGSESMTKKLVMTVIAASVLYCSPLFAQADIVLTQIGVVSDYCENDRYGLKDAEGNVILEPTYEMIYPFYGGYAKVLDADQYGLIDEQGNLILPAAYDNVLPSYYMPVSAAADGIGYNAFGYFAVEKDGRIGFAAEGGVLTCDIVYASDEMDVKGASAFRSDPYGNRTIVSADGVETSVDGYSSVSCLNYSAGALYKVQDQSGQYGVLDWHGNEVLPCIYYGISLSSDGNYMEVQVSYSETSCYLVSYDL